MFILMTVTCKLVLRIEHVFILLCYQWEASTANSQLDLNIHKIWSCLNLLVFFKPVLHSIFQISWLIWFFLAREWCFHWGPSILWQVALQICHLPKVMHIHKETSLCLLLLSSWLQRQIMWRPFKFFHLNLAYKLQNTVKQSMNSSPQIQRHLLLLVTSGHEDV